MAIWFQQVTERCCKCGKCVLPQAPHWWQHRGPPSEMPTPSTLLAPPTKECQGVKQWSSMHRGHFNSSIDTLHTLHLSYWSYRIIYSDMIDIFVDICVCLGNLPISTIHTITVPDIADIFQDSIGRYWQYWYRLIFYETLLAFYGYNEISGKQSSQQHQQFLQQICCNHFLLNTQKSQKYQ